MYQKKVTSLVLALLAASATAFTTPQKYGTTVVGIGTSPLISASHIPSPIANHKKQNTRLIQMSDTAADGEKKGFMDRVRVRRHFFGGTWFGGDVLRIVDQAGAYIQGGLIVDVVDKNIYLEVSCPVFLPLFLGWVLSVSIIYGRHNIRNIYIICILIRSFILSSKQPFPLNRNGRNCFLWVSCSFVFFSITQFFVIRKMCSW